MDSGWDQHMRTSGSPSSRLRLSHVASPHRCPLKTLQKCEIALEKLKNDMAVVSRALCLAVLGGLQASLGRSGHIGL